MSGKAYTMREMKTIVEYLVEHKAYNEIRGRKMWMDFANAKALNRTWQSLKETFLKRILPDIHNPYYKLNITQIASFRQGCDVESKLNNKLDIELVDKDIDNENGHPKANDEKVIIDDDKEKEEAPGEASKISKSVADRTSTDTLVLENCYETAEDIQKELEHSDQDHDKEEEPTSTAKNNTEDLIQGVINDFQSDEDNVDELKQTKKKKDTANLEDRANLNGVDRKDQSPIEISDSEDKDNNLKIDEDAGNESPASLKIVEDVLDKNLLDNEVSDENLKNTSDSILSGNKEASDDRKGQINKDQIAKEKNDTGRISGNITNTTVDTQLPNNPEEFDKNCSKDNPADRGKVQKLSLKSHNKQNKKRATSQEAPKVKRKKLEQQMSVSDTDAVTNTEKKARKNIMPKKNSNTAIEEQIVNNDAQIVNLDSVSEEKTKSDAEKIENNSSKVETNIESEKTSGRNENSYAKQLSYTIYSDSGNSIDHTDTSKQQTRTSNVEEAQTSKTEQVLHSDSSIDEVQLKNKSALRLIEKKHRNNALSHALGFSHDIISSRKRRRSYNRKRSTSRHKTLHISSGTSDYTSDTMSEFISPPRGRKNRGTRKYLKPKSARILSLEEEGGLFVMHGKKIYPLVKDGKILKNYLTYTPDDESDKEESFWKLKYVEEKKKADQLAKLLKQATNSNKAIEDGSVVEKKELKAQQTSPKKVQHEEAVATTSEIKVPDDKQENTVKIKFTKNNEEVQLEGHWTHINPVLEQVVQMFNKNSKDEDKKSPGCSAAQRLSTPEAIVVSGVSTPVVRNDNGTNRVNEIESEIFKQIEEIDKAEAADTDLKPTQDVARRRGGRPRKNPAPIEKSTESPKKAKLSVETEKKTESKPDAPGTGVTTRRSTRTPKKVLNENTEKNIVINRKSSPRKAKDANRTEDPDDGVKYKFPSPGAPRARSTRRARNS
ncbi:dentin sialophosphoprotein-like [Zerene cesonia]|uniref:dentin sialophosphoprotein-like n=1 Tax=Zerene cesonia TaxID=33412 RepID=UPI0018E4DDB2|nr:dentin sialophosphoprotein-like [Zerene cesonia]